MKALLLFIMLALSLSANAQILKNTNLNLNIGGRIYDVAYDAYYDAYVVVGDFTTINGQPRTNLAFIDANTFTVLPKAPITSIDGVIRTVEVYDEWVLDFTLGAITKSYLYIGGDFTNVNGNARTYLSCLYTEHQYNNPPPSGLADYSVNAVWNANITYDPVNSYGVRELLIHSDTLIVAGDFVVNSPNLGLGAGQTYQDVLSLKANDNIASLTGAFLQSPYDSYGYFGGVDILSVDVFENKYYLTGDQDAVSPGGFVKVHDLDGSYDASISFSFTPLSSGVTRGRVAYSAFDTVYVGSTSGIAVNTQQIKAFGLQGGVNLGATPESHFEAYNSKVYGLNYATDHLYVRPRNSAGLPFYNPTSDTFQMNNIAPNGTGGLHFPLNISRDKLFLSVGNLFSVDASTRVGLAVFCLEPRDAQPFTQSEETICKIDVDSAIYTIPPSDYAEGYRWSYTGSDVMYRITGSGDPWVTLSSSQLFGANTNSIELLFTSTATSGTLTVEPFSEVCNTANDHQYSNGQSISIGVHTIPDIILAPTHTLNCYADTINMVAQSSLPNVEFSWTYPTSSPIVNDSLTITQGLNLSDSSYYVVLATDTLSGCFSMDSTYFTTDLIPQPIQQSAITTNPLEFTCQTDSMAIQSNITGATVYWTSPSEAGQFSDPYWIDATTFPSGDLTVHATYLSNGCSTQANFGGIIDNRNPADGILIGYNYQGGGTPIDTLDCANDTLVIQCDVTAPFTNSTAEWLDVNDVPTGSDILTLTQADANGASFIVRKFRTTNNDNGCIEDYNVLVICDFALPFVDDLQDQTINCSQSEILLTHPMNGSTDVIEGWLNAGVQTNSDTITASQLGDYIYEVQSTLNGCTNYDTVSVTASLDLWIDMPTDTLICPEQVVSIAPSVIGNSETPSYAWSTGGTNSTENATGGVDSLLIVTISTPSGCTGTDSTWVLITQPAEISVSPFIACNNGSLQITNVTGGAGAYQYSLDGSTWLDSTNFSGLAFGTYNVFVQDSLGCVYDTTALLDGTALNVEMEFAVMTYNAQGDTAILVNTTTFTGLDSVAWNLPPTANVTYESDSIVILSMADSGWYELELVGYLGLCEFSFTSPVYFGYQIPTFDDSTSINGIEFLGIYPNPLDMSSSNTITVDIEFGKTQNYTLFVTNSLGQPIPSMSVQSVGQIVSHQLSFPSGTAAGTYRVHIISDYDTRQAQIILN